MFHFRRISASILLASTFYVSPALAQATRTWVSGVGDDANPCSRTAPCKTFAGAISKTAAGGEIDCLDPGGFGTLTITKSITIDCSGTYGSVLATGTNGININDSASGFPNSINVVLRGLSINGAGGSGVQNAQGNPGTGLIGINFTSGASLVVEDVIIQRFNSGTAAGIRFAPAGSATLSVHNSQLVDNGASGTGGGILVAPAAGSAANARVTLADVHMMNNANAAFRVDTSSNTNATGVFASIDNSTMSGSVAGVTAFQPAGAAPVQIMVSHSQISNNSTVGLIASGASARIRVGSSIITNNGTAAIQSVGGVVNSYGNNQINGNATSDGTFTSNPLG